jgi:hypothetical protein
MLAEELNAITGETVWEDYQAALLSSSIVSDTLDSLNADQRVEFIR